MIKSELADKFLVFFLQQELPSLGESQYKILKMTSNMKMTSYMKTTSKNKVTAKPNPNSLNQTYQTIVNLPKQT